MSHLFYRLYPYFPLNYLTLLIIVLRLLPANFNNLPICKSASINCFSWFWNHIFLLHVCNVFYYILRIVYKGILESECLFFISQRVQVCVSRLFEGWSFIFLPGGYVQQAEYVNWFSLVINSSPNFLEVPPLWYIHICVGTGLAEILVIFSSHLRFNSRCVTESNNLFLLISPSLTLYSEQKTKGWWRRINDRLFVLMFDSSKCNLSSQPVLSKAQMISLSACRFLQSPLHSHLYP